MALDAAQRLQPNNPFPDTGDFVLNSGTLRVQLLQRFAVQPFHGDAQIRDLLVQQSQTPKDRDEGEAAKPLEQPEFVLTDKVGVALSMWAQGSTCHGAGARG